MSEDWSALADAVRERRQALGLRQSDLEARGGPSLGTVRNVEARTRSRYASRTFAQLERALSWPPGSVARIVNGEGAPSLTPRALVTAGDVAYEHEVGAALLALLDVLDRRRLQVSGAAVAAITEMRERRAARG